MDKKMKNEGQIAAEPVVSQPEDCFELINKYGTYEIQPTCDSDNKYPEIAQGRPKGRKSGDRLTENTSDGLGKGKSEFKKS